MKKTLNLCKTISCTEYTCIFTNKKGCLLVFLAERAGEHEGLGWPPILFSPRTRMGPRNFSLRLKFPAPAMKVIGEQAAVAELDVNALEGLENGQ